MQSRTSKGIKQLVITLAAFLYVVAVIYGDIMFLQIVHRVFPNGFLGTLALVGAFVAGGTAILLPVALHWWHAQGIQQVVGFGFYLIDFAVLSLNAILAYQLLSNGHLDTMLATWLQICPATPLICGAGWAILFALDSSHAKRHAQQNLEADLNEHYAKGLANAARSPEVQRVIHQGALLHAQQQVSQLLGVSLDFPTQPQLPQPQVNVTSLPTTGTLPEPTQQQGGLWNGTKKAFTGSDAMPPTPTSTPVQVVTGKIEAMPSVPLAQAPSSNNSQNGASQNGK